MNREYLQRILLLLLWLLIPLLFIVVPTSTLETDHTICLLKNIMGLNCPGCGMTRALSSVFHANLAGAFYHNKSVIVVFPLLCYIYTQHALAIYRRALKTEKGGLNC